MKKLLLVALSALVLTSCERKDMKVEVVYQNGDKDVFTVKDVSADNHFYLSDRGCLYISTGMNGLNIACNVRTFREIQ